MEFLEELRKVGRLDSSGVFTLDPSMVEKLRQHQLADRYFYAVPLVGSAFLSGATEVRIRNDGDELELHHDGRPPAPDELPGLLTRLLGSEHDPVRELAVGVNAGLALSPRSLRVEAWDGEQGAALTFSDGNQQFERLREAPFRGVRVHLRESPSWLNLLQSLGWTPEGARLQKACRYTPRMRVLLNGKAINGAYPLEGTLAWVLRGRAPLEVKPAGAREVYESESPGEFSAVILVGVWDSQVLELLVDGLVYAAPFFPRSLANWAWSVRVLASSSELRLDLSRANVVQNDAYRAMVDALAAEVEKAVERVSRRWESLQPDVQGFCLARDHLRMLGDLGELERILCWRLPQENYRETYGSDTAQHLAACLDKRGDLEGALAVLRPVLKIRRGYSTCPTDSSLRMDLAMVLYELGRYQEALKEFQRSYKRELGGRCEDFCHLANYGRILRALERHQEWEKQRAWLERRLRKLKNWMPFCMTYYALSVGDVPASLKWSEEWVEQARKSLAWALDPAHGWTARSIRTLEVEVASALSALAVVRLEKGEPAVELVDEAVRIHRASLGEAHPATACSRLLLAVAQGRWEALEAELAYLPSPLEQADVHVTLACHAADEKVAARHLNQALELIRPRLGPDHPRHRAIRQRVLLGTPVSARLTVNHWDWWLQDYSPGRGCWIRPLVWRSSPQ